jgi:hypothetical protein
MAAPPAAHLEQFRSRQQWRPKSGRWLSRAADELPDAPFLAGEPMRRAVTADRADEEPPDPRA